MINPYKNSPFGYYVANGNYFANKLEAILSLPNGNYDLKWVFFDQEFGNLNWLQEPDESLSELYRIRAQQIRDSYDYVVLCYSGGADSYQVLESFVRNNILMDEICFFGAFAHDKNILERNSKYNESKDKGLQNLEIRLVAAPYVKQLQKKWPNLKIDIYDRTQNIQNLYLQDHNYNWLKTANNRINPGRIDISNIHRENRQGTHFDLKGKKVVYVWGFDKPRIVSSNGSWYVYFLDTILGRNPGVSEFTKDEYFYWSPAAGDIMIKQAHVFKRFIEADPLRKKWFATQSLRNFDTEKYNEIIKPAIYPDTFRKDVFTSRKASIVFTESNDWFYDDSNRSFQIFKDGLDLLEKTIDKAWLNNGLVKKGYVGCVSPLYKFS